LHWGAADLRDLDRRRPIIVASGLCIAWRQHSLHRDPRSHDRDAALAVR
jgi:hypothetical protein